MPSIQRSPSDCHRLRPRALHAETPHCAIASATMLAFVNAFLGAQASPRRKKKRRCEGGCGCSRVRWFKVQTSDVARWVNRWFAAAATAAAEVKKRRCEV